MTFLTTVYFKVIIYIPVYSFELVWLVSFLFVCSLIRLFIPSFVCLFACVARLLFSSIGSKENLTSLNMSTVSLIFLFSVMYVDFVLNNTVLILKLLLWHSFLFFWWQMTKICTGYWWWRSFWQYFASGLCDGCEWSAILPAAIGTHRPWPSGVCSEPRFHPELHGCWF